MNREQRKEISAISYKIIRNHLGLFNLIRFIISSIIETRRMSGIDLNDIRQKGLVNEIFIKSQIKFAAMYSAMSKTVGKERALEIFNNGGIVIGVGKLPSASDRAGANDAEVDKILMTIFGHDANEAQSLSETFINKKVGTGIYFPRAMDNMAEVISPCIKRDFYAENGKGSVLHRKIGDKDLFMVMDIDIN